MTDIQDPSSRRDGTRLVLRDLACISGTLSEISTVWRRAKPYLPDLPLILPVQLQDTVRQLAADIQALADCGPAQLPDPALSAADRFGAVRQSVACAEALTGGPGIPDVGDRRLWESLRVLLRRAGTQLAALGACLVAASG